MTVIGLETLKQRETKRANQAQEALKHEATTTAAYTADKDRASREAIANLLRSSREKVSRLDRASKERIADKDRANQFQMNLDKIASSDRATLQQAKNVEAQIRSNEDIQRMGRENQYIIAALNNATKQAIAENELDFKSEKQKQDFRIAVANAFINAVNTGANVGSKITGAIAGANK